MMLPTCIATLVASAQCAKHLRRSRLRGHPRGQRRNKLLFHFRYDHLVFTGCLGSQGYLHIDNDLDTENGARSPLSRTTNRTNSKFHLALLRSWHAILLSLSCTELVPNCRELAN